MIKKVKLSQRRGFFSISLFKKFVKELGWCKCDYLVLHLNKDDMSITIKKQNSENF